MEHSQVKRDYLSLALALTELDDFPTNFCNPRQCKNLLDNIRAGLQEIKKIIGWCVDLFRSVLKDHFRIVTKAVSLVKSCSTKDWKKAAILQMTNREAFRELILELEFSYTRIFNIVSRNRIWHREADLVSFQNSTKNFHPSDSDEISKDQDDLCRLLDDVVKSPLEHAPDDLKLADYLIQWRKSIAKVENGKMNEIQFFEEYPKPNFGTSPKSLGKKNVFLTSFVGFESITKVLGFDGVDKDSIPILEKEVRILAELNHPNIIKMFFCGYGYDSRHLNISHIGEEASNSTTKRYLQFGMEKCKKSLREMLFVKNKNLKMTFQAKVDAMAQISSGMCYLHDMRVVHRDLKPDNVVVTPISDVELEKEGYICPKLIDFGLSKIEVEGSILQGSNEEGLFGTNGYFSPESKEIPLKPFDLFKSDVYGFGLVCCDILACEEYQWMGKTISTINKERRLSLKKEISKIDKERKLSLQNNQVEKRQSMEKLKFMIEDCLQKAPSKRPSFFKIYKTLMEIKELDFNLDIQEKIQNHYTCTNMLSKNLFSMIERLYCCTFINKSIKHSNELLTNKTLIHGPLEVQLMDLKKRLDKSAMLGIFGMHGIGKTTLITALKDHFEKPLSRNGSSVHTIIMWNLQNDHSKNDQILKNYHISKLNQILKDLKSRQTAHTFIDGKKLLLNIFQKKKVIIIIDDVTKQHCNFLKEFLSLDMFDTEGSKLIATSRDLYAFKGFIEEDGRMELERLNMEQSMKVFSKHAFRNECFIMPHLDLVYKDIVKACNGHPLILEIMGSSLNGQQRLRVWERSLKQLKRATFENPNNILTTLKVNFDDLTNKEKEMFLDIACYFCNNAWIENIHESSIIQFWNGIIDNHEANFKSLKNKSLIKVNEYGFVNMHDLLRDMGRAIIRNDLTRDKSQEWKQFAGSFDDYKQEDFKNIQGLYYRIKENRKKNSDSLTIDLERTKAMTHSFENSPNQNQQSLIKDGKDNDVKENIFGKMVLLSFSSSDLNVVTPIIEKIQQEYVQQEVSQKKIQNQLKWLRIAQDQNYARGLNDDSFHYDNKVYHDEYFDHNEDFSDGEECSNVEDEGGKESFNDGEEGFHVEDKGIEGSGKGDGESKDIESGREILYEAYHNCLSSFFNCDKALNKLSILEMVDNIYLQSFQIEAFKKMTNLETLCLKRCKNLQGLPNLSNIGVEKINLSCLSILDLTGCESLKEVSEDTFEGLTSLEKLYLEGCKNLKYIQASFKKLTSLKYLYFKGCEQLQRLPPEMNGLTSLKLLCLSSCKKLEVDLTNLKTLTSLTHLSFKDCHCLYKIDENLQNLTNLMHLQFEGCMKLKEVQLDFGSLTSLSYLDFEGCTSLLTFPMGIEKLKHLEELYFTNCRKMKIEPAKLGALTSLTHLCLEHCKCLETLDCSLGNLSNLEHLNLYGCNNLKHLHNIDFGNLTALKTFNLQGCKELKDFPKGLGNLATLEELYLTNCSKIQIKVEELRNLKSLTRLCLKGCTVLSKNLDDQLGKVMSLEHLGLPKGCKLLSRSMTFVS